MNHKTTHRKVYKMWGGAGPEGDAGERKEGEEAEGGNENSSESSPSSTPFTMPQTEGAEGKSPSPSNEEQQPPQEEKETMYKGVKDGIVNSGNNFLSNMTDMLAGPKESDVPPASVEGPPEPRPMDNSPAPPLDTHNDSIVKDLLEIVKIKEQNTDVQTNLLKELVAVSTKLDILLNQPQSPLSPGDGDDKLPDAQGEEEGEQKVEFDDSVPSSPTNGEDTSPALPKPTVSPPSPEMENLASLDDSALGEKMNEEPLADSSVPGASSEKLAPTDDTASGEEMNGNPIAAAGSVPGASSEMNGNPLAAADSAPGASSEDFKRTGGAKSFRRRQKRNGRRSRKYKYRYVY